MDPLRRCVLHPSSPPLRLPARGCGSERAKRPVPWQEFIEKLKAIDGVSQVETQEITFESL